ncbi:MAG: hypothetical protein NVS1B2_22970 [Vulcanimicrobiaceae bacterium]
MFVRNFVHKLASVGALIGFVACSGGGGTTAGGAAPPSQSATQNAASSAGPGRGFPVTGSWATFYGPASALDLARAAATFRILAIDADPGANNFTPEQIAQLRAGGSNRVISYFNIGAIERSRTYWSSVPTGYIAPAINTLAQLGPYQGYPDEVWMNPANAAWQRVLLEVVAPTLVARGIDGFYFDNLEILTHHETGASPACDPTCVQGGFDLIAALRARYPNLLFVMQGGTESTTRNGRSGSIPFPTLLDGVTHESVYTQQVGAQNVLQTDPATVGDLTEWTTAGLHPGGQPFFVGSLDYVNSCDNATLAAETYRRARAAHFSPYASNTSANQSIVCYWGF